MIWVNFRTVTSTFESWNKHDLVVMYNPSYTLLDSVC